MNIKRRALKRSTPDDVLLQHIQDFPAEMHEPSMGVEMTRGFLHSRSVPHTREQVREAVANMNPVQHAARASETTRRREYSVTFINSLWHMDGHHKLIRWRFVIHGAIDGKSHLVTFVDVNDNNRFSTVLALWTRAVNKWGWPQRVRGDYGGQNLGVKEAMEQQRGRDVGAFPQGPSTRNQESKGFGVNVRQNVVEKYIQIFNQLENENHLDPDDAVHLCCFHFVYMPMDKASLATWVQTWSYHGTSGGIGAARNGFHIDYHPWEDEAEEKQQWRQYLNDGED